MVEQVGIKSYECVDFRNNCTQATPFTPITFINMGSSTRLMICALKLIFIGKIKFFLPLKIAKASEFKRAIPNDNTLNWKYSFAYTKDLDVCVICLQEFF